MLLFVVGCEFGERVLIDSEKQDLIGIWNLIKYTPSAKDNVGIDSGSFQFNADGTCTYISCV